ncbi:hypothetical protein PHYPSEUDO_010604 [Phytophthora pseudosyringae]|uniref:Crinkler (CRN) family protein n=1 Tax=Phytophthora pseudosyringae TaxID=221518 RepID=A0A8T1VCS8_9STRA|nr:hypothetical protein PHYPSEUDO_010604 [Phytophthora pseudosyringae]
MKKHGVYDTSGLTLLGEEGAPLRLVGLSENDVRLQLTTADVAEGKVPVHVLVKLPDPCNWQLADDECPVLTFDQEDPIVRIPKAYAQGSGLYVRSDGLLLFQRQEVQKEWQALWKSVVQSYAALWVVGPPGTGKSCAAFAFACSLKRGGAELNGGQREEKWEVLWIHCSEEEMGDPLYCILFSGDDEKRTCTISRSQVDAVLELVNDYTVVFLDGYGKERDQRDDWRPDLYRDIPSTVASSLKSMAISPAPKSNTIQSVIQEQQLFKLFSWTLKDYQEALKNHEFFEHVRANLTAESSVAVETRMELLDEKFFVVGGNARLMFDGSTESAMDSLLFVLDTIRGINQYLEAAVGCSSGSVVNRLFSWYPGIIASRPQPSNVSTFVAREIGLRTGPAQLQDLAKCLAKNPAMAGWLFDMFFFSLLTNGGATIRDEDRCEEVWVSNEVVRFDPDGEIPLALSQQWLAPLKWNQAGYDAVFFESKDLDDTDGNARDAGFTTKVFFRIVQVTRSETHSFKVDYYKDLLSRFTNRAFILPVDEVTFRREGMSPVFYPSKRTGEVELNAAKVATDICIRVVALEYDMWSPRLVKSG